MSYQMRDFGLGEREREEVERSAGAGPSDASVHKNPKDYYWQLSLVGYLREKIHISRLFQLASKLGIGWEKFRQDVEVAELSNLNGQIVRRRAVGVPEEKK